MSLADGWDDRWVKSKFKSSDEGPWELSAGKHYGDADNKGNAPLADPAPVSLLQARDFGAGPIVGVEMRLGKERDCRRGEPLPACVKLCSAASMRERMHASKKRAPGRT